MCLFHSLSQGPKKAYVCPSYITHYYLTSFWTFLSLLNKCLSYNHMEITNENKTDENILEFPVFRHVHKGQTERMNVITHQQKMEKSTKSKWDSRADTSHSCSKTQWRVASSHAPLSECCLAEQSLFTKFNSKRHRVWTKIPSHEKALCSYAKVHSLLHMIQLYRMC